ncbi:hypothetical protein [Mongoliitalea lutea]|nr:hypothetical protein [Mongoliitalea lutea]
MKRKLSLLIGGVLVFGGLSFGNLTMASDGSKFQKEYCSISQAEKCKQTGTTCDGKKICFWKDVKDVVTIAAAAAAIVASVSSN